MKANDFLKLGEKYFYIHIPSIMLSDLYNVKFKIEVTSKTKIEENTGYVAFTFRFNEGAKVNFNTMVYDKNVFENHALIEDGSYETIITKYDKSTAKKVLMGLAYKKLKRISPMSEENRTILRHNLKYLLKKIEELKL